MNSKQKQKWIEALRSGKYRQGRGRMYNEEVESYCCLGIYCLIPNSGVKLEHYNDMDNQIYPLSSRDYYNKNDNPTCMSFFEIADFIEANQPTYEIT